MRWIAAPCALLLPSCTDAGAAAEKRSEMVERTGSRGEICDARKGVADAYLQAGNEEKYRWWHMMAESSCLLAQHEGRDGRPSDVAVVDAVP